MDATPIMAPNRSVSTSRSCLRSSSLLPRAGDDEVSAGGQLSIVQRWRRAMAFGTPARALLDATAAAGGFHAAIPHATLELCR